MSYPHPRGSWGTGVEGGRATQFQISICLQVQKCSACPQNDLMLCPQRLGESKISKVEHLFFLEGPLETQDVQMRHFFVFSKRNYGIVFISSNPEQGS